MDDTEERTPQICLQLLPAIDELALLILIRGNLRGETHNSQEFYAEVLLVREMS
ncbi:hypothetical protein ACLOJK_028115, partial [Asimina triloba]